MGVFYCRNKKCYIYMWSFAKSNYDTIWEYPNNVYFYREK